MPEHRRFERSPDAVGLLALGSVAGGVQLATDDYPAAVTALAEAPWPAWWAVSLLLACVVALAGIAWPHPLAGRVLELAGRLGVTVTAAAYTWAFASRGGDVLVLAFTAALAVSSAVRVLQLAARLWSWWVRIREEAAR